MDLANIILFRRQNGVGGKAANSSEKKKIKSQMIKLRLYYSFTPHNSYLNCLKMTH